MIDGIFGDWGSSSLRLWLVQDGMVVERRSGRGIAERIQPLAEQLEALVAGWPDCAITLCGMAGARDGLTEVPYADCPADANAWRAALTEANQRICIAPGLACINRLDAPDVMRGEEAQIFGAMQKRSELARGQQLVILPGTHSKWAEIEEGRIVRFTTAPTGELFALLRDHSLLIGGKAPHDPTGFADGLARIRDAGPGQILSLVFEARSRRLREARSAAWAAGFASGLLIGAEILSQSDAADISTTLIGDPALVALYASALAAYGRGATMLDGEEAALAGLIYLGGRE